MRNQLLLFIVVIFTFSCTKNEIPIEQLPEVTLQLLLPAEDSQVSHCCLTFEWEPLEDAESYRFVLSPTSNLSEILIDATIESTSMILNSFFIPGLKYYWQVEAIDSELSEESSFTIIDYGEKYSGQHSLTQDYWAWLLGTGTTADTSYSTNILIQEMIIPHEDIGFIRIGNKRYKYIVPTVPNVNEISFYIEPDIPHNHDTGKLFLLNDSLYLSEGTDANGGAYSKITSGILTE